MKKELLKDYLNRRETKLVEISADLGETKQAVSYFASRGDTIAFINGVPGIFRKAKPSVLIDGESYEVVRYSGEVDG